MLDICIHTLVGREDVLDLVWVLGFNSAHLSFSFSGTEGHSRALLEQPMFSGRREPGTKCPREVKNIIIHGVREKKTTMI